MSKENKFNEFYFFSLLIIINLIGLSLAIIFYREKFLWWSYPLSYAGWSHTYSGGFLNSLSMYIYSVDMFLSGGLMLWLFINRLKHKNNQDIFWFILPLIAAIGFFIAAFSPDDTAHNFHVIGSASFVVGLWLITLNYLVKIKKQIKQQPSFFILFILQLPMIAYGLTYFANLDISNGIQKIAIVCLFSSLIYATYALGKLENVFKKVDTK